LASKKCFKIFKNAQPIFWLQVGLPEIVLKNINNHKPFAWIILTDLVVITSKKLINLWQKEEMQSRTSGFLGDGIVVKVH
jgi:hypothetical protein